MTSMGTTLNITLTEICSLQEVVKMTLKIRLTQNMCSGLALLYLQRRHGGKLLQKTFYMLHEAYELICPVRHYMSMAGIVQHKHTRAITTTMKELQNPLQQYFF